MTTILQVEESVKKLRTRITQIKTLKDDRKTQIDQNKVKLELLEKRDQLLGDVNKLLQQCNVTSRDYVKEEVEKLTTQALQSIFEDPKLSFTINFVSKRNQIEAEFLLSRGQGSNDDILYAYGGGVVDVVSISLRIILSQLLQLKGPLILDEPGKNISAQFIENFGRFLDEVSRAFNRQIILVTHNERLAAFATNRITVTQTNGVSHAQCAPVDVQAV